MNRIMNNGVSIITSTIRPSYIRNVFNNYLNQRWSTKELIILLNKNNMDITAYRRMASKYANVRVFKLPEHYSLGECLNYAVRRAKYTYIAKFDDDDYYGPNYMPEAMRLFKHTKADIVGKQSFYLYFPHRKTLMLRRSSSRPYRPSKRISGATIMFHKRVSQAIQFVRVPHGTDARFLSTCLKHGFLIYSSSRYHFAAIRRLNVHSHTWTISERQLLTEKNSQIIRTPFFKKYVNRVIDNVKNP